MGWGDGEINSSVCHTKFVMPIKYSSREVKSKCEYTTLETKEEI